MSSANQIAEGFLDKIQDVGQIAAQNLLMKNAHPIVKIIKAIRDAKIFAKTIQVIQPVKGLSCLDNQALLVRLRQQQQQQKPLPVDRKHPEPGDKSPYSHRRKKNQITIIQSIVNVLNLI